MLPSRLARLPNNGSVANAKLSLQKKRRQCAAKAKTIAIIETVINLINKFNFKTKFLTSLNVKNVILNVI